MLHANFVGPFGIFFHRLEMFNNIFSVIATTVLPAKSDSDDMFCLQSYQGHRIDISLVY